MGNRVFIPSKLSLPCCNLYGHGLCGYWIIPQEVLTLVNQGDMKIVTVQDRVTTISCQYRVIHAVILSRSSLCKSMILLSSMI